MTLGLDKVTWNVRVQTEKQDSDCTQEEGTSRALPQTFCRKTEEAKALEAPGVCCPLTPSKIK